MKKSLNIFLLVCLLIPSFMFTNTVDLSAKKYSSSSSHVKSRNNNSLNSFNSKNNYSTSNKSTTSSSKSYRRSGGLLGGLFIGSLLFGDSPILSSIVNIIFIMVIISLIIRLLRPKRQAQTYEQPKYQSPNESHHMNQVRYINELVDIANRKDIDVSYILDDDQLTIDEKAKLIKERVE